LANRFPGALQISARGGEGLTELRSKLADCFADRLELVRLLIPYTSGSALSELYSLGPPIEERRDEPEGVYLEARLSRSASGRFSAYVLPSVELPSSK
jgi:50S ribosomal subunit-associated GTPase HflX